MTIETTAHEFVQSTAFGEPAEYEPSHDIARVATDLIARHKVTFEHLRGFHLLYLARHGEPPTPADEGSKAHAIAKAFRAPPLWRDVTAAHGGFWVWSWWWDRLADEEREAVCLHELLHLGSDEKGRFRLNGHDVESFALEVRTYGAWDARLQVFAQQLALFDQEDTAGVSLGASPDSNGNGAAPMA